MVQFFRISTSCQVWMKKPLLLKYWMGPFMWKPILPPGALTNFFAGMQPFKYLNR